MRAIRMPERLRSFLKADADDHLLRGLFGVLLLASIGVLALDYAEMQAAPSENLLALPGPASPAASPLPPSRRGDGSRRPFRMPDETLAAPMKFELLADGRMAATGTITPGTADAFAAEIAKRGAYVKTIVLHSPGGSVRDALAIGRLIRARKFDTAVENGRYCASSCPLIFAGGIERRAGEKAAIGVHQVSALSREPLSAETGMDNAQRVSAECQRFLRDMGIDAAVWLHAMETPKEELYYFENKDMLALKLATQVGAGALAAGRAAQ